MQPAAGWLHLEYTFSVFVYHIAPLGDWEKALAYGCYRAPSLVSEGFIHCSTYDQVVDTANRLFRDREDLVLLVIDTHKLASPLRHELAPDTDMKFPHIYGPLNLDAINAVVPLPPLADGSFAFPLISGRVRRRPGQK